MWHGPPLSYLNGKKLTPIRIMNSANMNSKNFVNGVGIFNDRTSLLLLEVKGKVLG